jgi:hypothetical protein
MIQITSSPIALASNLSINGSCKENSLKASAYHYWSKGLGYTAQSKGFKGIHNSLQVCFKTQRELLEG